MVININLEAREIAAGDTGDFIHRRALGLPDTEEIWFIVRPRRRRIAHKNPNLQECKYNAGRSSF